MNRLFAAFLFSIFSFAGHSDGLQTTVIKLIELSGLNDSAQIGVSIRQDKKKQIAFYNSDKPLIPASNQKLLTTGASLITLGDKFTFNTRSFIENNCLWIIGDGDPAFGDPCFLASKDNDKTIKEASEEFMKQWTEVIISRNQPLHTIYIDDRIFKKDPLYHPDWPKNQQLMRYCPEVSALSYHGNTIHFFPRITNGKRANVDTFIPWRSDLKILNLTESMPNNGRSTVGILRDLQSNRFSIRGKVTATYWQEGVEGTIHDPALFFGQTIADHLRNNGIGVAHVKRPSLNQKIKNNNNLAFTTKNNLKNIIKICNQESDNLYAECLLRRSAYKSLNRSVSWEDSADWLQSIIQQVLKKDLSDHVIRDGSGMSRMNRISASTMSEWLQHFPPENGLFESLPLAGHEGTLKKRFKKIDLKDAIIRAKSGYLNNVSSLSGYILLPNKKWCSVSVIINLKKGSISKAKKLQEDIFKKTAEWLEVNY